MWYGWIPKLGGRLPSFRPPIDQTAALQKREQSVAVICEAYPEETFEEISHIHFKDLHFNDRTIFDSYSIDEQKGEDAQGDQQQGAPLKINGKHLVDIFFSTRNEPKYLILWSSISPDQPLATAKIETFDRTTGMVGFTVVRVRVDAPDDQGTGEQQLSRDFIPRQFYRVIRDCYHSHIWTDGDFGVFPERADGQEEAAENIWDKYLQTVIKYKYFLRKIFFGTRVSAPEKWLWAEQICAMGIGETTFAESLAHNLLEDELTRNSNTRSCSRVAESFSNIRHLMESKKSSLQRMEATKKEKEESKVNKITLIFTFLGAVAATFYPLSKDMKTLLALVVSLVVGVLVIGAFVWFTQRRYFRNFPEE